jgi:beta-glucosidase
VGSASSEPRAAGRARQRRRGFARHCDVVTRHLGDLIGVACILNEPNLPYLLKSFGIGGEDPEDRANVP